MDMMGSPRTRANRWRRVKPLLTALIVVVILVQICKFMVPTLEADKYSFSGNSRGRWDLARIWKWQREVGWMVGANYVPATAINQLEMFQHETWDAKTIDFEFEKANKVGMNCMRVFLHNMLFDSGKANLFSKMNELLAIADRHGIKILFVLFDACWRGAASIGPQPEPIPYTHNSGWLQSPSYKQLQDESRWDTLQDYVVSVIREFKDDQRIAGWDLYNEPSNIDLDFQLLSRKLTVADGAPDAKRFTREQKLALTLKLLKKSFEWARSVGPSQPLTSAIWGMMTPEDIGNDNWNGKFAEVQIQNSDVISFHNYGNPTDMQVVVDSLLKLGRPVMCTEYLARGFNSTILGNLPLMHRQGISAFNWGLFDGKTQTVYPWNSWYKQYTEKPALWHHDIFHANGAPFNPKETELILKFRKSNNKILYK